MPKCVLLDSGGIDSRILAAYLSPRNWDIHALHIPFNPHTRGASLKAAQKTADLYCSGITVMSGPPDWITTLNRDWHGLPFTGLYVHLVGAMFAVSRGIEYVASGLKKEVMAGDYIATLREMLSQSKMTTPPSFVVPFLEDPALADIGAALDSGIPLEDTHSCWTDPACGSCSKCRARAQWLI